MAQSPLLIQALLVAGTVLGTLGGARMPGVSWTLALLGLALLVAAGLLARFGRHRDEGALAADVTPELESLARRLSELQSEAAGLPASELVLRISALDGELVLPIGERAPRMLRRLGAERFAEVFGRYASGERALARAWSAAADQHAPEALASLELAARQVEEARQRLAAALHGA